MGGRGRHTAVLLLAVIGIAQTPVPRSTTSTALALRGATIYAAPDQDPIRDGVVLIRDGTIAAVGTPSDVAIPAGTAALDLTGTTLVAGFWNSHVHFSGPQWADAGTAPPARLNRAFQDMLTRWGFTTVVDTGSSLDNTLALRRRVAGGVDGPAIFTTGDILFPPGSAERLGAAATRYQVDTPERATAAARDLLDRGADAIKVYAQTFWNLDVKLSPAVLAAVVAHAHGRHAQVFAHPSNREGLYNSVDAGVDVLMHTTPQIGPWGHDLIARMRAAHIALVPTLTLWRFELSREQAPQSDIDAFQKRGTAQLREYFEAGGTILFGTDVGYMSDFTTLEEFQKMAEAGMGFRGILASLTTAPAAQRGLAERTGRIAAGFAADLTALDEDPAANVGAFARVRYTIRGGRIIYDARRH
jgi:imidazolonepropionase-like amidohydrolase